MSKFNQIVKSNKITPDNLKLLYNELISFRNQNYISKSEHLCSDVISLIVEYLIHGDKNNCGIFDVFCEYNFMNEFIYLNSLGSRVISIQIIQSFSLLILNISNPMTIYFLFSNNFINQIISQDYTKYDDEFIAYYINFIKSLSLKIDTTTIQFFFHEQHNSFPLIQSSIKFYNHPDSMIRTTVRNIFLTFLKLQFKPIYEYFTKLPSISYFSFLVINIRDLIIKLNDETLSDDFKNLKDINDDILDIVMYFQDIFSLKIKKINNILINCIFYYIVFPLLIAPITSLNKPKLNIPISIYVLTLFFKYIKDESFLNMLFSFIFFNKIDKIFLNYIKEFPQCPKNYHNWNNKINNQQQNFATYITLNFSENFIKSLIFQINSEYPEIIAIVKKYEKTAEEYTEEELYKSILEDVLSKFEPSEFNSMQAFHKNLSIATGENVGLKTYDFKQKSIINLTEHYYFKIKESLENDFISNECRDNLLCYFKSKDDSLIIQLSLLINTVHKSNICKEVLSLGKLLKASDFIADEPSTNNILRDIFSNLNYIDLNNDKTNDNSLFIGDNRESRIEVIEERDPFKINDNLFIEEDEMEISCNKFEESNKKQIEEINNENEINEENNEGNSLLDKDFLKIQKENIIEKTHKHNLSKKNLEKIIKINMENQSYIHNTLNSSSKDSNFDKNFFNTHLYKFKLQSEYDKDLVENLLNLLKVEPSFRTITLRLIIENIENLILQGPIDKNHLTSFNKIYYNYVSGIKLNIMNNKHIRENGYELLEIEWHNYKKDFTITINEIISQPFLLIPYNLEDSISDYPCLLKIQKTDIDNFKKSLIIFMNLYDLRSKIFLLFDNIKEFFPLNIGSTHYEVDKPFFITNKSELYQCKIKSGQSKTLTNIFMCIDQNYLVFCVPDSTKPEYAVVKIKYALRHIQISIDKGDMKVLNLYVKEKNNMIETTVYLDDVNKANTLKKQLEEHKKNSNNTEFILLVSYFDELLNKFNLDYNI